MTRKLTREWLQHQISAIEAVGITDSNTLSAFKLALAAMDSEPVRNPVLAYADSYRDMAKQGVESVPIWSVITDLERNIAPLYRHAQPAPVVPDENVSFHRLPGESEYDRLNRQREWMESKSKLAKVTAAAPDDITERLLRLRAQATLDGSYLDTEEWDSLACDVIKALNACRAAMLQESQKSAGASNNCRCNENAQDLQAGNSPVIPGCDGAELMPSTGEVIDPASGPDRSVEVRYFAPPGYVMVPKEPTDEMIAAAMNCDDVLFNSDESFCVQFGNIYEAMIAAAPQEVQGE
ncbi:hypothetical protein LB147_001287 [Raoultella ornithinolytica]